MTGSQDSVWMDVLPSMAGFGKTLNKESSKAANAAGKTAGSAWSDAFGKESAGASTTVVDELEDAQKKSAGIIQKLTGQVSSAYQAQKKSAAALVLEEQKLADAKAKYGDDSAQATAAELRLEAARDKSAQSTQKYERALSALKEEQRTSKTIASQLETAQSDLNQEAGKSPTLWGKVTDSLKSAGSRMTDFATSTEGAITQLAGAAGGTALLVDTLQEAIDQELNTDKMNAALAATPAQAERYGAVAGSLYASGYGESMEDITTSVDAVVSSMAGMRDASEADISRITEKALAMSDVFGTDVAEATTTAGALMKNGLAADADEAMDLMVGAMNKIPAGLRGEVMPVVDEYAKSFSALGIDGETAMGMIVASSADGAIGMDKMGDSLKEFTIRATDMSKSTSGVYELLGLDMQDMTNQLLAGGDVAEGAMAQIVHGLQGIEDPGEQAAAAIALFGTPLEDLSVDQIPNFLGMVDPMGDAFGSMEGSAGQLTDTLNDNLATSLETTKRQFQDVLLDGVQPMLGPLSDFLQWAMDTPAFMPAVYTGVGILAAAFVALGIASAVASIAASPWIGIAALIGAGIAAVVALVMNWGAVMGWLGGVISDVWEATLKPVWDQIAAVATDVWVTYLQPIFSAIGTAFSGMVSWVAGVWAETGAPLFAAIGEVATWLWQFVIQPTFHNIGQAFGLLVDVLAFAWQEYGKPVFDGIASLARSVYEDHLQPVFRGIGDAWGGMVNGIRDWWNSHLKPVFETFGSFLHKHIVGKFEQAVGMIGSAWEGLKRLFATPINWVLTNVWNNGIVRAFNAVADAVGSDNKLGKAGLIATGDSGGSRAKVGRSHGITSVRARAKGGHTPTGWTLVGEEGPELVDFTSPGRVYTAAQTAEALAAGQDLSPVLARQAAGGSPREALAPMGDFNWDAATGELRRSLGIGRVLGTEQLSAGIGQLGDFASGILDPLVASARQAMGGYGAVGDVAFSAAEKVAGMVVGWSKEKDTASGTFGGLFEGAPGGFRRPSAGPITSRYGPRWGRMHEGIDIAGGGPTYAAWNGVVAETGWNIGPGRTGLGILLNHGQSLWSYYGHNPVGGIQVRPGQKVKAGQHIGYQGATGNVTGVHLHWEAHKGGPWKSVNPSGYLHDDGGWHEPGTWSYNGLAKPEAVLTEPQWQLLERYANAGLQGSGVTITNHNVLMDTSEAADRIAQKQAFQLRGAVLA
ncbi:MAG: peptidoglycan DD-metalloendopeptidase family protein [Micrococcus sp.]|nr:peptidoglycan DD-metalloendopeptidase family protein [Micrococcus sp.]